MAKGRELVGNGSAKAAFKVAGVVFLAGVLWAKVSGLESRVGELTTQVNMLVKYLLGTS